MRKLLLLTATLYCSFTWGQVPKLITGNGMDSSISLHTLKVTVTISGRIASTSMELTFLNSSDRVLEGTLTFPLPAGVTVLGYALDINGKLREAVPVENQKATQVFERIERRRVDPGLLEKVEGNNFRTRIYPLPANGRRTVRISYDEYLSACTQLDCQYRLPLSYPFPIADFQLAVHVLQPGIQPLLQEQPDDLSFKQWNNNYTAAISRKNFQYNGTLKLSIPKSQSRNQVLTQKSNNDHYFMVNMDIDVPAPRMRMPSKKIGIVWDVSLSGLKRNKEMEWKLLELYFKNNPNCTVELATFSNTMKLQGTYSIINGEWPALKKMLESSVFDGATNLSSVKLASMKVEEYLLFTDGMSTFGSTEMTLPGKPVFTITSSGSADFGRLQNIARKTLAQFINLNVQTPEQGLKLLTEEPFQLIAIKESSNSVDIFPAESLTVTDGNLMITGKSLSAQHNLTVQFGYGKQITVEKNIRISDQKDNAESLNIARLWAQQKLIKLDLNYDKNKDEIALLGRQYSLVIRNTSLMVLETVQDYVQYKIEPPAELRKEYYSILKQASREQEEEEDNFDLTAAHQRLIDWWKPQTTTVKKQNTTPVTVNNIATDMVPNVQYNATISVPPPPSHQQPSGPVKEINGTVSDDAGVPISGASIRVKGSNIGVASNNNGQFKLNVREGDMLIITAVGIDPAEVTVGSSTGLGIRVNRTVVTGSEVVVTAMGIRRMEKSVGYEVSSVNGYSMNSTPVQTFANQLQGRVAGVAIRSHRSEEFADSFAVSSITLTDWVPDRTYLAAIEQQEPEAYYKKYIELREEMITSPTFYFDMAGFFFRKGRKEEAIQILSNIAELLIDDHELFKMLGYRLREAGDYENALEVFKKVLTWRNHEPQSYRDYALALADVGLYQESADFHYIGLTRKYPIDIVEDYDGIEEVMLTEFNNLLVRFKDKIKRGKYNCKLFSILPVDIRVVLSWNRNDTDIDLWVTDPAGEKCFFGNTKTKNGAMLSADITEGYGPEQLLVKKALPGKYKIMGIRYYYTGELMKQ